VSYDPSTLSRHNARDRRAKVGHEISAINASYTPVGFVSAVNLATKEPMKFKEMSDISQFHT